MPSWLAEKVSHFLAFLYQQLRRFGFFFLLSIHAQTSLMAQITDTIRTGMPAISQGCD